MCRCTRFDALESPRRMALAGNPSAAVDTPMPSLSGLKAPSGGWLTAVPVLRVVRPSVGRDGSERRSPALSLAGEPPGRGPTEWRESGRRPQGLVCPGVEGWKDVGAQCLLRSPSGGETWRGSDSHGRSIIHRAFHLLSLEFTAGSFPAPNSPAQPTDWVPRGTRKKRYVPPSPNTPQGLWRDPPFFSKH